MNVNLYTTTSETEEVFKEISAGPTLPCELVNTDILNPILKLDASYIGYNYVGIPSFGNRFYYVSSVESIPGNHILMKCTIDVLYTYKNLIANLECDVVRSESKGKTMVRDEQLPVSMKSRVYSYQFGYDMGTFNYILTVI